MINAVKQLNGLYSVQQFDLQGELKDWSIAICPEINQEIQRVLWRDGERGRIVDYEKLKDLEIVFSKANEGSTLTKEMPSKVTVIDQRNSSLYVLKPLTLQIYRENIKERLSGRPDFESDKEMTDFFLNIAIPKS